MLDNNIDATFLGVQCHAKGDELPNLHTLGTTPTLAIKGGHVIKFSGRTIRTITTTFLLINLDITETCQPQQWFQEMGSNASSPSLSKKNIKVSLIAP